MYHTAGLGNLFDRACLFCIKIERYVIVNAMADGHVVNWGFGHLH